jgi:hypothetical protein
LCLLLCTGLLPARAAETETREFRVSIDGKPAGDYRLTIQRDGDRYTVQGAASIRVRVLFISYRYSYNGQEVWKDGRLQRLDSQTDDDGKRFTVSANANGEHLQVTSNGQTHQTRGDAWTTSYWHRYLAKTEFSRRDVVLLDVDTGKEIQATLHHLGSVALSVNGREQNCTHYKLRGGGLDVDLWYDAEDRLVREESIEDGHRMKMELTQISK